VLCDGIKTLAYGHYSSSSMELATLLDPSMKALLNATDDVKEDILMRAKTEVLNLNSSHVPMTPKDIMRSKRLQW